MKKFQLLCILVLLMLFGQNVLAQEFSSTDYKALDPVIMPAEYSTSGSFRVWSTVSQMAIGTSSSAGFNLNSGFLYFPFASSPAVSTTAGDGQVSLSWSASTGYLGWTPTSYSVARATVAGGPYTYTSAGGSTSAVESGLSNGTTYYFVVVVKDAFGNQIASSTEVSATPASSGGGGGGGGGGGSSFSGSRSDTGVIFSGRAYPLSKVSILKDGQLVLTTIAGPDSKFNALLNGLSTGNYTFAVFGQDNEGRRSAPFTFPVYITSGVTTSIGGIFIAPTIATDKKEVKKGDNIAIFGQSTPNSEITININSEPEFFVKEASDDDGVYLLNFDSSALALGSHSARSKAAVKNEISPFGESVAFKVGTKNVLAEERACSVRGDLNQDCRVNLVDFSIAAYWYKKTLSTAFSKKEAEVLDGNNKIDLKDFSIMAFYWTG